MSRKKIVPETFTGQILAIPRVVKRSEAYRSCSTLARALLIELADQHNGSNNGRLHLSYVYLRQQGFNSKDQIAKGRDELISRNLIVLTRQGGLPVRIAGKSTFSGASWFALTWHRISNFIGLDIVPSQYEQGAWDKPFEFKKRDQPPALKKAQKKSKVQPVVQDYKDPQYRAEEVSSSPCHRSLEGVIFSGCDP